MAQFSCNCRCSCTVAAVIASALVGIITAFFQITGVITVLPVFLWVVFGIAVVYLGILTAAAFAGTNIQSRCRCSVLNSVLIGILGSVLLSVILLAVGIVATSVVSAILVGLLLFFFALTLTASACLIRNLTGCSSTSCNA